MDRIEPLRPRPPAAAPIPSIRRNQSATERDRDASQERRRREQEPPEPPSPPDDGLPHVDVRV